MNEERIIELETRLTYQEEYIRSLNDTVVTLQQQLNDVITLCESLGEKLKYLDTSQQTDDSIDQVPPHY